MEDDFVSVDAVIVRYLVDLVQGPCRPMCHAPALVHEIHSRASIVASFMNPHRDDRISSHAPSHNADAPQNPSA